ncbi:Endonuclease/exonuclease/phosphatase [Sparassis latifolia]|uniref:DNA-(apurinic or apyrimidinic site) endonuclease n=1 Tax=Sparassis crispa TaxID=139825 RepID=A0A401GVN7_9APHY|nr:DNA-(apurinic or apyrimidinic site) lyase 2 [Sparassis crispa]GBE86285.1 DNA-(apurinic or apyrimidinic site) lyase 2 [Sparassis crispa]
MRILSWNINGIRTLPQYHPWNTFKSCEGILDELQADIICFQEMKTSRIALQRDMAIPGPYHSFFSFPASKGGYSGVAVYTDSRKVVPLKAEEGLSGKLQAKPPLSVDERVSPAYPMAHQIEAFPDEQGNVPSSFDALDAEGRGLVLDFGLFVLINVYCPNETSDARLSFKMNYHLMLQERVRKLIEEEHREVIVVGDMNVCATPLDHCDGHLPSNLKTFWDHPARTWFHSWLDPNGPMIDIVRSFWPDRKGLYTCWNTKLSARETNYGTRVDYILVTRGLLPWIALGDIQPSLKGSDHCPIYIDLRDELVLASGATVTLRDAMRQDTIRHNPPRLAAMFWEEFSSRQTVISAFFGKQGRDEPQKAEGKSPSSTPPKLTLQELVVDAVEAEHPPSGSSRSLKSLKPAELLSSQAAISKRKSSEKASSSAPAKKRKNESGQAKLGSFFKKPPVAKSHSREVINLDDDDPSSTTASIAASNGDDTLSQLEADYQLACELSASEGVLLSQSEASSSQSQSKSAWSSLFAPVQPPNCSVHGEPTKLYTVNKQGPNKGKTFYLCSRPVGPGYDRGKLERLRDEVDPRYRCNYFKWASEHKRDCLRETAAKDLFKNATGMDS